MAKIYGLFGSMQGKVADVVMAVRNGEQIVRKYQPIVSNPSTSAQVAARAKMKTMSQLSAVMAPVIAIPRLGTKSSRNLFVKINYPAVTYAGNQADVNLTSVKLTDSVVGFGVVSLQMSVSSVTASVAVASSEVNKVVFAAFQQNSDNALRFLGSQVVDVTDGVSAVSATIDTLFGSRPVVVYAYGIRLNNENARTTFGNISVTTAEMVAQLIVTRTLKEGDITLTETTSAIGTYSQQSNLSPDADDNREVEIKSKEK